MAYGLIKMKKAFTLVEMIVVIGIIAILMGAIGTSVAKAQLRSRIARAHSEANEMTNAIRAYENYVGDTKMPTMNDEDASESKLGFLLGNGETDRGGNPIPVLYNASIVSGMIRDPWGTPYRVRINAYDDDTANDPVAQNMRTGVFLPNRYNRLAGGAQ